MTDITEISGIGSSKADDLAEAGFESAEDIAAANPSDIQAVEGFGDARSKEIHEKAVDLISVDEAEEAGEDADSVEGADEGAEEDAESTEGDGGLADGSEAGGEEYILSLSASDTQRNHLLAALARREVEEIQRKDMDRAEAARDIIQQVIDGGDLELTEDQVHLLYSAITALTNDYHGTRGLTELSREIRDLRERIKDFREDTVF